MENPGPHFCLCSDQPYPALTQESHAECNFQGVSLLLTAPAYDASPRASCNKKAATIMTGQFNTADGYSSEVPQPREQRDRRREPPGSAWQPEAPSYAGQQLDS